MRTILTEGFAALGLSVSEQALGRFETYYRLLDERGSVMNLTAIRGEADTASEGQERDRRRHGRGLSRSAA